MSEVLIEESDVKTRHKKKLEQIRGDRRTDSENSNVGNVAVGSPGGANQGSSNEAGDRDSSTGGGAQGVASEPGAAGRYSERVRPLNGASVNATESNDRVESTAPQQQYSDTIIEEFDSEAEKERKRELNRQRQARYRENQRETGMSEHEALRVTSPPLQQNVTQEAEIRVKNVTLNNAEVKLLTKEEVSDSKDKLIYLYLKGSEILDDILEIIVRDHEPVQIWAMDQDEAEFFATMQLERARKDKGAARTVRILLKIHERLYWSMYAGPRLKASYSHVREHKGFSFK